VARRDGVGRDGVGRPSVGDGELVDRDGVGSARPATASWSIGMASARLVSR